MIPKMLLVADIIQAEEAEAPVALIPGVQAAISTAVMVEAVFIL